MKLADCVDVVSKHVTGNAIRGYDSIGGLEHYDTGEVEIYRWGKTDMLESSVKEFESGDVLVARRNVYLKRASVAKFGGVTSGDSIVLRAKDKSVVALLPFVLNTNSFWDFADQHADGTMSKRLSPKAMLNFEFSLPPLAEQKKLAETLWAMERVKRAYKSLLAQTDALAQARFVEMFGKDTIPRVALSDWTTDLRNGMSPSRKGSHKANVLTLSAITQGSFDPLAMKDATFDDLPPDDKRVSCKDFYICRGNGNKHLVGKGVFPLADRPDLVFPDTVIAARVDSRKILLPYLACAWEMPETREQIERNAKTTNGTFKISQEVLALIKIPLPPLALQREFAAFIAQQEKAKASLEESLAALTAAQKALMNSSFAKATEDR